MKTISGNWITCAAIALLAGCTDGGSSFRIVETSDVHGNFFSMDFMSDGVPEKSGGMARVSSFLNEQRKAYGKNLIYVDNGDMLRGDISAYYDRTADYDSVVMPAAVLDYMGCAVSNLGNQDLSVGFSSLDEFMMCVKHPVLCANLVYEDGNTRLLPAYSVVDRKGVRIAFVGLITPTALQTVPRSGFEGLSFMDICDAASEVIPQIRAEANPDVVIGLVHSGLDDCVKLAQQVEGIDAILFGYDGEAYCDAVVNNQGDSIWLLNPGYGAQQVGVLDFNVKGSGSDREIRFSGALQDVSTYPANEKLRGRFSEKIAGTVHYADSVIGVLGQDLDGTSDLRPNTMMDMVHSLMLSAVSAQISLAQPQIPDGYQKAGPVTVRDLFRLFPNEHSLSMVMLTGKEVVSLLEYSAQQMLDGNKTGYFTAQGINYTIDASAQYGNRVTVSSMADGKPYDADGLYRVVIDSFFANGGQDLLTQVAGISRERLAQREAMSTSADIRFLAITRFSLSSESGKKVEPERNGNWSVVNLN